MTKHQYLALLTLDIINRGHSTTGIRHKVKSLGQLDSLVLQSRGHALWLPHPPLAPTLGSF